MTAIARIRTLRGLCPSDEQITDDDILEIDGEAPRSVITVPPPSGKRYIRPSRYSMIAPRAPKKPTTLRLIVDDA